MWGETVTLDSFGSATDGSGYHDGGNFTDDGSKTWTANGYKVSSSGLLVIGKGGANYLQTPNFGDNEIKSITVTWYGNTDYYLALQTTDGTELEAIKNPSNASDSPATETFTVSGGYSQLRLVGRRESGTDNAAATISSVVVEYGSACDKSVTISKGTESNCTISFSSASVLTCSGTRQVTVSVTPSSCYAAPVKASVTSSGTTATWVSGPTLNAGHYDYVYSFAENATGSTTFNCSLSTKTTYTVQYNAGATTCTGGNAITGSHADDTKTCGTNLTLPGETFHTTGYTQTGWTKSSCGSQTNGLGGSYTSNAAQTFYPVWTANSYTVTWMVNGVAYSAGGSTSVNYGSHVETLPTAPTPPCGNKFMGWTTTNIGSVGQATDAGLNLFTTAGGAPTISAEGPVTYYAVFADYAE